MKALLAVVTMAISCLAQEAAPPKEAQAPAKQTPAPSKETRSPGYPAKETPAPAKETPAASPAPSDEQLFTGSMEVGYRWRTGVGGSLDTYRSVVDLGSGPKLLGTDFTLLDPSKRLFDRVDVRAQNWGDDPYSTAHVSARKAGWYDFSADYRNMAYFNALPSFANPMLTGGPSFNERSFDIRRRFMALQLDLKPNSIVTPFLAFERSSGYGRGVTTFVSDLNEYPVPTRIRDSNDLYRGGARIEFSNFHATAEVGGTVFKDDQQIFEASSGNPGNRQTPYLGQQLFLTNLQQSYGVRGSGIFTRLSVAASPFSWLDLHGYFIHSRPETDTNYQQYNTGNFAVSSTAMFVTTQQFALASSARMPHSAGSAGLEVRPWRRTRVLAAWLTDRLENTGTANFNAFLRNEYNQADIDVIVDATRQLTLRAGYRYVWGDAQNFVRPQTGLQGLESAALRRNIGKGGFTYRPASRISINTDVEAAASGRIYFRTSLNDYQRASIRARLQATNTLTVTAGFKLLNNQNPAPGIEYDFMSRSTFASFTWTPDAGKRILIHGGYSRDTLRSDTTYIAPQSFERERSFYRDNAHSIDGRVDFALPQYAGLTPRLSVGGAFFFSSGSRPTQYYQPVGNATIPLTASVAWTSEWRYHGYGESFYGFEAFRTHLITTGIRINH